MMTSNIVKKMSSAGLGSQIRQLNFLNANRQISGDGTFSVFLYAPNPLGPRDANPIENGDATRLAAIETYRHLQKTLAK